MAIHRLSVFRRFITTGMIGLDKKRLVKLLRANQIDSNSGVYNCFENIQRICQKLVFSQIYDQDPGLAKEELEFFQKLADMKLLPEKKNLTELIRETSKLKVTDYLY